MSLEQAKPQGPGLDRLMRLRYEQSGQEASLFRTGLDTLIAELPHYQREAKAHPFVVQTDYLKRAGELRLIAPGIPKEFGGLGLQLSHITKGVKELSYYSPGHALSLFAVPHSLVAVPIEKGVQLANDARRHELVDILRRLQSGVEQAFFGLTEPNHSSDVAQYLEFQATPTSDGTHMLLNGQKSFITNPEGARWGLITASLEGETVVILVDMQEKQQDGSFTILGYHDKIGQYGPVLTSLELKDFRVPRDAVLGTWKEIARPTLIVGRNVIAGQAVGAMIRAMDIAYGWANYRIQSGEPLVNISGIAQMLLMGFEQILVCEALLSKSVHAYETGNPYKAGYASLAKLIAADSALSIGIFAQQLLGARGYVRGYYPKEGATVNPFEQELRQTDQAIAQLVLDMMAFPIYEGPRSLQSDVLVYSYFWDQMDELGAMLAAPDLVWDRYTAKPYPPVEKRLEFIETLVPSGEKPPKKDPSSSAAARNKLQAFLERYYR